MAHHNDLDRAIDAAADAIMRREPNRSLGAAVMARVREGEARAPRRFVWATAVTSLVLCAAIAVALISRTPSGAPLPRDARVEIGRPPVRPRVPESVVAETVPTPAVTRERRPATRVATRMPLPPSDSQIEPIQTEPIMLSSIDVPQLDRESTAIDTLTIEPLTIEPLATSND
jgi:hypothetical protein